MDRQNFGERQGRKGQSELSCQRSEEVGSIGSLRHHWSLALAVEAWHLKLGDSLEFLRFLVRLLDHLRSGVAEADVIAN